MSGLSRRELKAIFAKTQGMNWSRPIPYERQYIKFLQDKEGNYELLDKDKKRLYVGSSSEIKHRVESYGEEDDPKVHPTKVPLRPKIKFFRFRYLPLKKSRDEEKVIKQKLKYNMDSKRNEKHKEIRREKLA